ncbi:MlaD family protein [Salinimicrobium sp. HB62]|uniref:MlaD family protein n=1 Tax=Salinimicrobium sp. HB62 TaxID=3077781 RepID=UPI002D7A187D|nr:MlaD family protein [Salinimicrobium sp. HB62]
MKNSNAQNFRLGLFIITGVLIFVAGVYFIGNRQNLFGSNPRITSVFKSVDGLQVGNNVRYAGVNVGTVRVITIVNDTSIAVDFIIQERTMNLIRKNSLATISSDGLVGSMIVNLVPGDSRESEMIQPGDTLESISKVTTADMLTTLNTTNENAALLTADLLKITAAINNGEGTLGLLIKDQQMAEDVKESMNQLRHTTRSASSSVAKLSNILGSVDMENSLAGKLLTPDSSSVHRVEEIIASIEKSAFEIEQMTANLNQFSNAIKNNDGVLNFIMKDTTFVNNLDKTLENAEAASKKLDENMKALQHNILFRGYFKKKARREAREASKE